MLVDNSIYISPKFRIEDYLNLNLDIYSSQDEWKEAIKIFEDRINGRFFNAIYDLQNINTNSNIKKYDFAIMALEALLVETMLQFKHGLEDTNGVSRQEYTRYLKTLSSSFTNDSASAFYRNVRCGILHSGQTYGNTVLTQDDHYIITMENDFFKVSVPKFTALLYSTYKAYCKSLMTDTVLKGNFITKMNYICNR